MYVSVFCETPGLKFSTTGFQFFIIYNYPVSNKYSIVAV